MEEVLPLHIFFSSPSLQTVSCKGLAIDHYAFVADYCNGVLAGLPASQLSRMQSVLHAAARLNHGVRQHDHVTPLLQQLHWLSVPKRVTFKLCVIVYRCLRGIGPGYLSDDFRLVSEIYSRQRLRRPPVPMDVVVLATRRSSLGDRTFPVAGARAWNALPPSVTSAPSPFIPAISENTFLLQRQ